MIKIFSTHFLNLSRLQGNDLLHYSVVGRACKVQKHLPNYNFKFLRGEEKLESNFQCVLFEANLLENVSLLSVAVVIVHSKMNSCAAISGLIMLVVTNLAAIVSFATPYWREQTSSTEGLWATCHGTQCQWVFDNNKDLAESNGEFNINDYNLL